MDWLVGHITVLGVENAKLDFVGVLHVYVVDSLHSYNATI
jgi:hypothetical protein